MEKGWNGLPYITISEHYQKRFGAKVYKIPVSVVDDCPNRRGLKGMQTCVFCDPWGSAAKAESLTLPLKEQIEKYHAVIARKFKARDFLVYFQAYTNTFTKVSALRANFETALSYPFVRGLVVGTRPDCLSPAVFQLWQEMHERSFVAVEIGVQSFFDDQLTFMRRGHTGQDSIRALQKISQATSVDLGIHLMFGQPGETDEQVIETARICNDLPITNVKLHNLHVLKETPLQDMFFRGEFSPIEREDYARRVRIFLEHLSPKISVHRLAAFSSRWDELIAPAWTGDKMGTHQAVIDHIRCSESGQSLRYEPRNPEESELRSMILRRAQRSFCSTETPQGLPHSPSS